MKASTKVPPCSFRCKLKKLVETALDVDITIKETLNPILLK